ncbi:MAG: tetratricopeptide repeat protein [Chloroflexi bacterium]|nr:tetratricopeptide repeat protein [Chloroflexota bacterium]
MTKQQIADNITHKRFHSKAFKAGLDILVEEIRLALQWNRPSILLAVHSSKPGQIEAQQSLEKEICKMDGRVAYIDIEGDNPDVIRVIGGTPQAEGVVFFVSGIEKAERASNGNVYSALNIRRELLVEKRMRVVFWLTTSEAEDIPRLAPDFWAFRHRVVEFAPKRGSKKQSLPAGLFLWKEQIPWMEEDAQKNKLAYYEEFVTQLPQEENAASMRMEALLKLVHYSWLLNDLDKFSNYLTDSQALLEKYPISQYQAWVFNAEGIGAYERGNKPGAVVKFKRALANAPENGAIMLNTGFALHGLGKNSSAALTGRQASGKDQGNSQLWRGLGYLFLSMGRIEDAIENMTKAQIIDPYDPNAYYSLAVCYHANSQHTECIRELIKAEAISSPQNIVQRVCAYILNGRKDEALVYLRHSKEEGKIKTHCIQRDPNLHFLLSPQELSVLR